MKPFCGAYKLEHDPTGQYILGSSNDVVKAVATHLNQLAAGKHANKRLQRIWDLDPDMRPFYWLTTTEELAQRVEAQLRESIPNPLLFLNPVAKPSRVKGRVKGKPIELTRDLSTQFKKSIAALINKKK